MTSTPVQPALPPTRHRQVQVLMGDSMVDVDEGIAPLIRALQAADVQTVLSCEDNTPAGYVWICFPTADDAGRFLIMAAGEYGSDLYWRVRGEADPEWLYDAHAEDWNASGREEGEGWVETTQGEPIWVFSVSVRFPRTDLPAVLRAFNTSPESNEECARD